MFLYIKTNILRGYGIFKNDFAHPREPAITSSLQSAVLDQGTLRLCTLVHYWVQITSSQADTKPETS